MKTTLILLSSSIFLFYGCSNNITTNREAINIALDYIETQNNKDYNGYVYLFHPESEGYSFLCKTKESLFEDYPETELKYIRIHSIENNEAVLELEILSNWENVKRKTFSDTTTLNSCVFVLQRVDNGKLKIRSIEWQLKE